MRMLITAGPTREFIDAVRFISNRSSGRMGLEIARAAADAGHEVTLLLGPVVADEESLRGFVCFRFQTAAELKQLIEAHWADHRVLVMAAAVSDYRPVEVAEGKLPRRRGGTLTLHLQPTPDLVALAAAGKRADQRVVAFALEEVDSLESRAAAKLKEKKVDAVVANPLGTMESDAVTAVWLTADGGSERPGRMSKREFARWLISRIEGLC